MTNVKHFTLFVTLLFSISFVLKADDQKLLESSIVSAQDAAVNQYVGSVFNTYFLGQTKTSKNVITGVAVIEPNHEIHPPHQHQEEEFLMILAGEGTWLLNGIKSKAQIGDILYAAPGDLHGIFNTGKTPLKFVVVKWEVKSQMQ
ncbi:cupin domain-containing protein [Catenovulum maritimum]|uniref:cupin domain-containing protein n=1 Tax=Catenovulum maritimum TaxID=1513271 RepID=UPI00097C7096|nr:cupin domain-containing protein [Catenovulum maritimum]